MLLAVALIDSNTVLLESHLFVELGIFPELLNPDELSVQYVMIQSVRVFPMVALAVGVDLQEPHKEQYKEDTDHSLNE
jgi:hypothetical protein